MTRVALEHCTNATVQQRTVLYCSYLYSATLTDPLQPDGRVPDNTREGRKHVISHLPGTEYIYLANIAFWHDYPGARAIVSSIALFRHYV